MVQKAIQAVDKIAEKSAYWIPTVLFAVAGMSWLVKFIEPIAQYGWAADVGAGIVLSSLIMAATALLLMGWRYFNPLVVVSKHDSPTPEEKRKIIAALVPPQSSSKGIEWLDQRTARRIANQPKEFTHKTALELVKLYADHLSIKADNLFAPYVGLWITVPGEVFLIENFKNMLAVMLKIDHSPIGRVVGWFSKDWESKLMQFDEGDRLTIVGRIRSADHALYLENCEITNPPTLLPAIQAPQLPQSKT